MVDKRKKSFRGKSRYLFAACAVVSVSVLIILLLFREEGPAQEMGQMEVTQQMVEEEESKSRSVEETMVETETAKEESGESTEETLPWESVDEPNADSEIVESQETLEPSVEKEALSNKEVLETVEVTGTQETENTEEISEELDETGQEAKQETQPSDEPEVLPEKDPEPDSEDSAEETQNPSVHEHSWIFESYYQKPTCSNGGLVNQICAHCGETQTTVGTPTGEHQYKVETPGDCCNVEVIICSECNHREVREKDPDKHIDEEDGFCYGCGQKTE